MEIKFIVYGKAQPGGSKRGFPYKKKEGGLGVRISDMNPKASSWKHDVISAAMEVCSGELLTGPLQVRFTFFIQRPQGHYGTGRNAGKLKPSAPTYPTKRPDVLKLSRPVEDALTGVIWKDDSQIVRESLQKLYCGIGERQQVDIYIGTLAENA